MKDGEIKNKLSPAQVSVMRHRVTEPPYFGKYWDVFTEGTYRCAACETILFSSGDKFDSKTGWPSFRKPINERDLQFKSEPGPDDKVEIRCKKCKSHLGYVIAGDTPYYRINSVCLVLEHAAPRLSPVSETQANAKKESSAPVTVSQSAETISDGYTMRALAGSVLAGIIIGFGSGALYFKKAAVPVMPETATTTPEIASTTSTVTETNNEPEPESAPEPETPTTNDELPPESPQTGTDQASSTQ